MKSVQIPIELWQLLKQHFKVGFIYEDIDTEETTSEYYQREDRIKAMIREKDRKIMIRNAYKKIVEAPEGVEKERARQFYEAVKKTL